MKPHRRFDPLNLFGVLEGLTIISLIYCPAPFFSTSGYPMHAIVWSISLGVLLASVAFAHAILEVISFRVHLLLIALVGATCLMLSFFSVPNASIPRAMFMAYGIILLSEAIVLTSSILRSQKNVVSLDSRQDEVTLRRKKPSDERRAA
jgi:hypothetical protein